VGWPYGDDFWIYTWDYDYLGGYPSMIISGDDRYCYLFFSATVGTNNYTIGWTLVDLGFV
jgi:hypothetical protein